MADRNQLFTRIAQEQLGIQTLTPQNRDHLDFHDVGVLSLRDALDAAYRAGQAAGQDLVRAAEALLAAKDNQMETIDEWRRLRKAVAKARKNS